MSVIMRNKTVEITAEMAPHAPKKQLGEYKLKRWSWYEKQLCMQRATIIIDAQKGLMETPMVDYNTHMVNLSLVEAPFKRKGLKEDLKQIQDFDPDVGDILFKVASELNTITQGEKADFTEPPGPEDLTPG